MRKQVAPPLNDQTFFSDIIKGKNLKTRVRLTRVKPKVFQAYENLIANAGNLGSVVGLTLLKTQKKDLKACYTSGTKALKSLKGQIVASLDDLSKDVCPYCGYRDPSSFDHYFPQSRFAEFSVFSKNLIWVCQTCNHRKLDDFHPTKRCLHVYYDLIPDQKFLYCDLSPPYNKTSIKFFLQKPNTISATQYNVLESHFELLKLNKSYIRESGLLLPTWIEEWKELSDFLTKDQIVKIIQVKVKKIREKFSNNYYEVALLEAVLEKIDDILL